MSFSSALDKFYNTIWYSANLVCEVARFSSTEEKTALLFSSTIFVFGVAAVLSTLLIIETYKFVILTQTLFLALPTFCAIYGLAKEILSSSD